MRTLDVECEPSTAQIDAATAHAWGLVNRVVPAGEALAAARSWAAALTQRSPLALSLCKQAIALALDTREDDAIARSLPLADQAFGSVDAREGSVKLHDRLDRGRERSQPEERFGRISGMVVELNEAFACQALACVKGWGSSMDELEDRLNVNGSGISLGHPVGATGVRIMTTLLHELQRRGGRYGLETMCIGGGQGIAAIFERA